MKVNIETVSGPVVNAKHVMETPFGAESMLNIFFMQSNFLPSYATAKYAVP